MASRTASPWGRNPTGMIVTTTNTIEGHPAKDYYGIVTGEVIVGANMFRDLFASITDLVGGRSGQYEEVLGRARTQAIEEMVIGKTGSMLMVSVSGTAVLV